MIGEDTEAIVKNLKPMAVKRMVRAIKLDKQVKDWKV